MTKSPDQIKSLINNRIKVPTNTIFTVKMGTYRDAQKSRGDLGNQLFQLSAGLVFSWMNNCELKIETWEALTCNSFYKEVQQTQTAPFILTNVKCCIIEIISTS